MTGDIVNGLFELGGAIANLANVRALWQSKKVRGVSIGSSAFFTSWGLWNLYYYPSLEQWASFWGGVAIVVVNAVWVVMALFYSWRERNDVGN